MKPTKWRRIRDDDDVVDVRQVGPRAFQFVEIMDLHAATGDNCGERYHGEVVLVDLNAIPAEEIASARRSCGWEDTPDSDLATAEMCFSYGCRARLWNDASNNRSQLMRAAKSEARALLDPDAFEDAMDRPVNAIGSTAREFMQGDIASALQRACEAGDPAGRIMAKMYGAPQQVIDDTRPLDWLPYVCGYQDALNGREREGDPDVAPEYHRGYDRGNRVKAGEVPAPSWIKTGDSASHRQA